MVSLSWRRGGQLAAGPGWLSAFARAPGAISELVGAVPALALGARFHGTVLGALWRVVCGMPALGLEPLAGILDLRLDAGEVHTAQGDQHLMSVQRGFERDAHRCLRQWRRGSVRLRWCRLAEVAQPGRWCRASFAVVNSCARRAIAALRRCLQKLWGAFAKSLQSQCR